MASARPTERQLLDLWERGLGQSATARAEALLALAAPQSEPDEPSALPLGERERRLLTLRLGLLGSRMNALVACPRCGERHEVELDVNELLSACPAGPPATLAVRVNDLELTIRPLNGRDLDAAGAAGDARAVADLLVERCVLSARRHAEPIAPAPAALGEAERAAVGQALSEADPLANVTINIACAVCGESWTASLDTAAYLWLELHGWAQRVLREVHGLAATYGWTEDEVLRLSPWRRAAYLSLAGR